MSYEIRNKKISESLKKLHQTKRKTISIKNAKEHMRLYRLGLKLDALSHYSGNFFGSIECCDPFGIHDKPITDIDVLTIDHINNDGNKHRKEIGSGPIYSWLKAHNYPEGFQTLCMNCQFKKQRMLERGEL